MSEIGEWLKKAGLERYAPLFDEHEITVDVLPHLTEADVEKMGLPIGPRRRLMVEIRRMNGAGQDPGTPSAGRVHAEPPPAPTGAERRQLTVMFCDLVGSTALSADLDPEELRELIQTYRNACGDVVARYEGHVAQYLGDGLLVYFGWPRAHEDDAERGVRAALDVVKAVQGIRATRALAVRVGLATGPVVVGEASGGGSTEARLAVGEAPNLAARLQGLAAPNQVLIAPATRRLVGDAFTLADLGAHALKGIPEPVTVWRVDAVRRTEGRFEAARAGRDLTPLVGREPELALLLDRWQKARAGSGQVVAIGGEAGIGKSRLAQALRQRLEKPFTSVRHQCSPYHVHSALYPFVEQLEFAAGFAREDPPETRLDKLVALLGGTPEQAAEAAPLLAALLSLPTDRFPPLALSPQKRKERTFAALLAQMEALSRQSPVLILFEDLHWVDPTSLEVIDRLVARLPAMPVLLVATHRPEWSPPWAGKAGVTSIALSRLERREVAEIVGGVVHGRALPPEVMEQIVAHTDGVPLFVEELTKSVIESGFLKEVGDGFALEAPLPALAIPTSLRDSLVARLDRLAPVKEIAQIGACIGREFSRDLLSRVAALAGEGLDAALDRLVTAGLITRRGAPPHSTYAFKHALVQDAAYDSLLKSRRLQLHAQIAKALETDFADEVEARPESLAHHHTQAGDLAAAIPLWRKAGALAIQRVALKEAVAHLQKALALTEKEPPSPERDALELTIRRQLNAAWAGLFGWAASEIGENTEAILRLAAGRGNTESLLLGLWWMWTNTITQGRIADSLPWAERLASEGAKTEDVEFRMFGPAATMVSLFFLGRLAESRVEADRALSMYDAKRAARWIQLTGYDLKTFVEVYACQLIWMMGEPEVAREWSDRSTAHARTVGHAFNLVWALTFGAYAFAYRREPVRILERAEEADRLARDQGIAFIYQVSVPQIAGMACLHDGKPREAASLLRAAVDGWTGVGGRVRVPFLKSALAQAVALDGDRAQGLRLLDECLAQIEEPSLQERVWLPEILRLKGSLLAEEGRGAEAEHALRDSLAWARRHGAKSWELRGATTLASLLSKAGRREEAREVLSPALSGIADGAGTRDHAEARALLESLTR